MNNFFWYGLAALGEIAGCFAFWAWLRLHKSVYWVVPGTASLILFACILTRIDVPAAGRAYAAYGGVYILSPLIWLWIVEDVTPDRWDVLGVILCVIGTAVIILSPRSPIR